MVRNGPPALRAIALRDCQVFATEDSDDACRRISQVLQPHKLIIRSGERPFQSRMSVLRLSKASICAVSFGEGAIDVPPLQNYAALIFCLTGRGELQVDGRTVGIDADHGVLCPVDRSLKGRFTSDCEQLIIRIPQASAEALLDGRTSVAGRPIALDRPSASPFRSLLWSAIGNRQFAATLKKFPRVAAEYENALLRLLFASSEDERAGEDIPCKVRPAVVRRAVAYMEANAASTVRLAGIAAAVGVSERSLLEAFQRFEGDTPMRRLRAIRLDRARARLMAPHSTEDVTTVAFSSGFGHLSSFSQAYSVRFGEYPSETLRRQRRVRQGCLGAAS